MTPKQQFTAWERFDYEANGKAWVGRRRWPVDNQPPPIGSGKWIRVEESTNVLAADNVWEQTVTAWKHIAAPGGTK